MLMKKFYLFAKFYNKNLKKKQFFQNFWYFLFLEQVTKTPLEENSICVKKLYKFNVCTVLHDRTLAN